MRWIFCFVFGAVSCFSATVCLNMIVKNERAVIQRCLESVLPIIDTWVIVDTGSTDGTQKLIADCLKEIPGELHERPWLNFGHNREEALQLAKNKADYILFMDADDILAFAPNFQLPELVHDFYAVASEGQGIQCLLPRFIKANLDWHWYDVLHEYVMAATETKGSILPGISYVYIADGARNRDPEKYKKDIALLEQAIQDNPNHNRYPFYLGQTYFIVGDYENALKAFRKRAEMEGFAEEVFVSKFQIGKILEKTDSNPEKVIEAYKEAYRYRPIRLEPIYALATLANKKGQYEKAFQLASLGLLLPQQDTLFVEQWMYEYGIYHQYAIAAYRCKRYWEALHAIEKLLTIANLPEKEHKSALDMKQKIGAARNEIIHHKLLNILNSK